MKATKLILQTKVNIRDWAKHYGLPLTEPIATLVYKNLFPLTPEFCEEFQKRLSKTDQESTAITTYFSSDPFPVNPSHTVEGLEVTARASYRENCPWWSAQIVWHKAKEGLGVIEIDFDEQNPNWGGAPAFMHGLLVLKRRLIGGQTNAFAVRKGLRKRGIEVEEIA